MAKIKKDDFEIVVEKMYWFLKTKLHFDDIQASTTIASIILLPITFYLGIANVSAAFKNMFFITVGLDILVLFYSFIKFKYFKNAKIHFIKESITKLERNKKITISNIQDVNNLNPYEFEAFAKLFFIRNGYMAWNTQQSHDNGADVIAEKGKLRTVIQVKLSKNSLNGYAVYQVVRAKHAYQAEKGVLFTNSQLTNGAILDSQRDNVIVINGHDIGKYLRNNDPIVITGNDLEPKY